MRGSKKYKGIAAANLLLAVSLYMGSLSVCAEETGTITTLSEKVYKNMDAGGDVVGNVIADGLFSILKAEYDAQGNVWYRIKTDMGIEGYIPAQNVTAAGAGNAQDHSSGEEGQEEDSEDTEAPADALSDDGAADSAERRIRTTGAVNVRSGTSTDAEVIGEIPQDTVLDYIGIEENQIGERWYEITYDNLHGYIRESTVSAVEASAAEAGGGGEIDEGTPADDENIFQPGSPGVITDPGQTGESAPAGHETSAEISGSGEDADDGRSGEEAAGEETEVRPLEAEENADVPSETGDAEEPSEETERDEETETGKRLRFDRIAAVSFAGSLVCMAVLCFLVRQVIKIYNHKK